MCVNIDRVDGCENAMVVVVVDKNGMQSVFGNEAESYD